MSEKISVSKEALRQVLNAFQGPSHHVMELWAINTPYIDNPVSILIKEFNEEMKALETPPAPNVAGFRLSYKDGSTVLIDRTPNSFELQECMIEPVTVATPTPPATIAWPPECEELCKAAEGMQRAVNELWKAQNPEELQDGDTTMSEDDAIALHNECWRTLQSSVYYMRKRMSTPPAPTPPAQEDEPVLYQMWHPNFPTWVNCSKLIADKTAARKEGHLIRGLYIRPANDKLMQAAKEIVRIFFYPDPEKEEGICFEARMLALRAALGAES